MKIIPAVDILDGKVVRLIKGSFQDKKEYSDDPLSIAKSWQDEGARYLHVVDLDGAKSGEPKNAKVIENIIKNLSIPVEVGGGIRTAEHIQMYLKFGVDRISIGTAVMHDLSFLDQEQIKGNVDKIALSLDFRRVDEDSLPVMMAGTGGWGQEVAIFDYRGLIDRVTSSKIKYLNYTDRAKDGTLQGLSEQDLTFFKKFLNNIEDKDIEVIYGGGISSLEDIKHLAKLKSDKLTGIIVGKALYEENFKLKEAQDAIEGIIKC
ncbi:HisA/HisF-related TIM barrel protein [Candidatus Omnitrophota bacterium]